MAIREVREMGDDVLEKQCKPVTKMTLRTKILIEDMLDTMYEKMGVGLAAPQAVYRWLRGSNMPSVDNLYALSRYLNTSMDDMIIEKAA